MDEAPVELTAIHQRIAGCLAFPPNSYRFAERGIGRRWVAVAGVRLAAASGEQVHTPGIADSCSAVRCTAPASTTNKTLTCFVRLPKNDSAASDIDAGTGWPPAALAEPNINFSILARLPLLQGQTSAAHLHAPPHARHQVGTMRYGRATGQSGLITEAVHAVKRWRPDHSCYANRSCSARCKRPQTLANHFRSD
jgi:hypothetical protein